MKCFEKRADRDKYAKLAGSSILPNKLLKRILQWRPKYLEENTDNFQWGPEEPPSGFVNLSQKKRRVKFEIYKIINVKLSNR